MALEPPTQQPPPVSGPQHDEEGCPAFSSCLSLLPLVDWWREVAAGHRPGNRHVARLVVREVERKPRLLEPFSHPAELDGDRGIVEDLLSAVFPQALGDTDHAVAFVPFQPLMLHCTPAFRKRFVDAAGQPHLHMDGDHARFRRFKLLRGYLAILQRLYGMDCELEQSFVMSLRCPLRGLEMHFQLGINVDFVHIHAPNGLPPLDEEQRHRIRRDLTNLTLLQELLPVERFHLEGVVIMEATDVTTQQAISGIKQELIDHASLMAGERLARVQDRLRSLLCLPKLVMRVGALHGDEVLLFVPPAAEGDDELLPPCPVVRGRPGAERTPGAPDLAVLLDRTARLDVRDFGQLRAGGSTLGIHEFIPSEVVLVEDLEQSSSSCPRHACLRAAGFRSCLFAPLEIDGNTVGVLELASPEAGDLDPMRALRLREALPLFALAVRRTTDSMDMRLQAVIKEQFTSIHPAVEWRFRRSALAFIRSGGEGTLEPIAFPDVHALFGVSDIRSSSTLRSQAIQADLLEQMDLAHDALRAAQEARALPILGELAYRVERRRSRIAPGLASGDETSVVEFLRREVEPVLDRVVDFGEGVRERVGLYRASLDERLGILYRRRRDFEDSVSEIADVIADYLAEEQERIQAVHPHYFEMHKTDGVDHNIYVGASMAEDPSRYDELYVRNLRLWQLMAMCVVARKVEELRSSLPLPLETAHLVLVQHQPLSIRFNSEEKQFNVDGAYNVRYEIVKKRIDKAEVRGTEERLTQPRKIAVVYSRAREAEEYHRYLEYLGDRGYVEGPIETLDLGELQGVQGLRAFRAAVSMAPPRGSEETLEMRVPVLQGSTRGSA